MTLRTASWSIALSLFMLPVRLCGQAALPHSSPTYIVNHADDRIGSHYAWGTVDVLLRGSAWSGLEVTVYTTARTHFATAHTFLASFPPDSTIEWLNLANVVVHPSADPRGPDAELATPPLRAASGDSLWILRPAKGRHWEKRISVVFGPARADMVPFAILARPGEVDDLLHGMLREASVSGYVRDSALASPRQMVLTEEQADAPPVLLEAGPLDYPDHSITGSATVEFIVDETGVVVPSSIHTLFADHAQLGDWARTAVLTSRFRAARLRDRPVAVWVRQRINYKF